MSDHKYKCLKCEAVFTEPKNYDADPKTRNCIICKKSKGNVAYLGCGKSIYGIMDSIEMKSMADGKIYTSKSKYYQSLEDNNSHIIEPGEQVYDKQRKIRGDFDCRKELKQAIQQHLH